MRIRNTIWLIVFIGLGCLLSGCGDTEPNTVSDYFEEGYGYYYNGKYKQAITAFQKVVEIDPSYVRAHFFMAVVYREQGRLEDAITKLKQTTEIAGPEPVIAAERAPFAMTLLQILRASSSSVAAATAIPFADIAWKTEPFDRELNERSKIVN